MNDFLNVVIGLAAMIVVFCIGGMVGAITTNDYEKGFCAARGGVWISGDYCDVEGKVVKVER